MDGAKKAQLFFYTVIVALATAWWLMPAFINIWKETATPNDAYGIGLFLGIVLGVSWSALIWYWMTKD